MEAAGAYSQAIALFLPEQDQTVSIVNPAPVKYYGESEGFLNKTDRADAA